MKQKVQVTIAGREYTLVATQEPDYVRKVASHVDAQIDEVMQEEKLAQSDAFVLAAMNIADQYFQELSAAENLRRQIKEGFEKSAALERELSECKRQIFKLQSGKR